VHLGLVEDLLGREKLKKALLLLQEALVCRNSASLSTSTLDWARSCLSRSVPCGLEGVSALTHSGGEGIANMVGTGQSGGGKE
jgi:hypothetical protein